MRYRGYKLDLEFVQFFSAHSVYIYIYIPLISAISNIIILFKFRDTSVDRRLVLINIVGWARINYII